MKQGGRKARFHCVKIPSISFITYLRWDYIVFSGTICFVKMIRSSTQAFLLA